MAENWSRSYVQYKYFRPLFSNRKLRRQLRRADIPGEGASIAKHGMSLADSSIHKRIDQICEMAAREAIQRAHGLTGKVQAEAQGLRLGADEQSYHGPVGRCSGDIERIIEHTRIDLRQSGEALAEAQQDKRSFCAANGLNIEPSFKASLLRWAGVGSFIALLEASLTASGYAHAVGWLEGGFYAGLASAGVLLTSIGISSGILLSKHRRKLFSRITGPVIAAASGGALGAVSLAAAHFRNVIGLAPELASAAASAVWDSVLTAPLLPLGELPNLGLFAVALLSGIGFTYETVLTWGYWGWRGHARRAHQADRGFKRAVRRLVREVVEVGEREKRSVARKNQLVENKAKMATGLTAVLVAIVSAHATTNAMICGEHGQALASLEEHYRLALPPALRQQMQAVRLTTLTSTELSLPDDFQAAMEELQREVDRVVDAMPAAIAAIDSNVAVAISRIRVLANVELARAAGVTIVNDHDPLLHLE